MNCFEWRNHVSDYLDGTLIGPIKKDADAHLDTCLDCSERYKRYRIILTSIASQPRAALPITIRKFPLGISLPHFDAALFSKARWERIPWFIRTTLEGVGIVALILLGISMGPKVRQLYEKRIEQNLSEFSDSVSDPATAGNPATQQASPAPALLRGRTADASSEDFADEVVEDVPSLEDSGSQTTANGGNTAAPTAAQATVQLTAGDIRVGASEIWRFIIKTDSPHEFRTKVVQILTDLKVPPNTPGFGGVEAPGGIQFDMLIPQTAVGELKVQLQGIAPRAPQELSQTSPGAETFTWYKHKSKRKLPDQRTRIVIWLSQM